MIKGKAILKVAPGLAKTPKGQGIFLIILVIFSSLGAGAAVYSLDTCCSWSPNHPLQVFGICPPPATIGPVGGVYGVGAHISCFNVVSHTDANGKVTNTQEPAGSYEYLNGSVAHP